MPRPRPNWKTLRDQLLERSKGLCEVSGIPLDPDTFDAHHRRNKGMGGTSRLDTDTLANLLALDPQVHNGGAASVHGRRDWSEERGYLIPKHIARVDNRAFVLRGEVWVLPLPVAPWYRELRLALP